MPVSGSALLGPAGQFGTDSRMGTTKALAVLAISHRQAPLALLEQVNLDAQGCTALARTLVNLDGVSEAVVLSTCNRTELYLAGDSLDLDAALAALVAQTDADLVRPDTHAWYGSGSNVARHLFRVAAGLESRVEGEREIVTQVRSAITTAREAGTVGSPLDCLFRSAIAVGRRVHQNDRTATARLPQLGLDAARPDAARPAGLTLVMGAGLIAAETVAELVARQMKFVVCARRVERAAMLARRSDQVVPFEELAAMLDRVEVVVCATGARTPLLSVADIIDAMARRDGKPLVIVDLSLPRNVDPAAGRLPGVRLLDLDDLVSGSSIVEVRRRTEVVDDEFRRFESWMAGQIAGRMIASLHSTVRRLCRDALESSLAEVGLSPSAIAAASHRIAGRLLHAPTSTIKALMADGDEAAARQILTSFGIPGWSDDVDDTSGVDAAQQHLQVIASARSVRLVARSGRRCGELGRVRLRPGSVAEIAS